jgi:hypothetical protein
LKELVQSEGWRLLVEQAKREFGPEGYGRAMQRALSSIPQGPDRAYEIARVAEQIESTAKAVNDLIKWPKEEIARLAPKPESRRPFASLRRT